MPSSSIATMSTTMTMKPSSTMESFDSFFPQGGIEYIYYDQLGSARSDQPDDTTLWVTARFVEVVR